MNPAGMALQHRGAAIENKRQIGVSSRKSFVSRYSQASERRGDDVTACSHRAAIGSSSRSSGAGHSSADRDYGHIENLSSLVGSTYQGDEMKNAPTKYRNLHLSAQCVDRALGPIIRNKPVKTVAHAAGRSEDTVKKWRTMVPEAWAAFVNLLTSDDEVYLAVMQLAGRKPVAALTDDQKRSIGQALKLLGVE